MLKSGSCGCIQIAGSSAASPVFRTGSVSIVATTDINCPKAACVSIDITDVAKKIVVSVFDTILDKKSYEHLIQVHRTINLNAFIQLMFNTVEIVITSMELCHKIAFANFSVDC